jgi:hypothetical protein
MSWTDPVIKLLVLIPILITGWQDYCTREASNLITIPYFFIGVGVGICRFHDDASMWFVFAIQIVIIGMAWLGGMGGADFKMQCGLFGLNPMMGMASLIAEGIWGLVLLVKHGPHKDFPKLSVMAVASILTFLVDVSIIANVVQFLHGRNAPV